MERWKSFLKEWSRIKRPRVARSTLNPMRGLLTCLTTWHAYEGKIGAKLLAFGDPELDKLVGDSMRISVNPSRRIRLRASLVAPAEIRRPTPTLTPLVPYATKPDKSVIDSSEVW